MSYDQRGYITSETDTTNYNSSKMVSDTFNYDALGRLTYAKIDNKVDTYSYDNVGNRLTKTSDGTTTNYNYNVFNELTSVTGGSSITYNYDARGNQTCENNSASVTNLTYNLRNQLTKAETPYIWVGAPGNGYSVDGVEKYSYNAEGQRVEQSAYVDGGQESDMKYYYEGSSLLYTTNADNNLETENILDLGGQIIASKRFEDYVSSDKYQGHYFFYHYDMRGDVTNIIRPDGTQVAGYTYDEFGNIESQTGNQDFLNKVTFNGSVTDTATGLQYMNARFYDPSTGRFITQDSISGNPYAPWTQNLYSYCNGNPINMVDPAGFSPQYISKADYNTQYAALNKQLSMRRQLLNGYSKMLGIDSSASLGYSSNLEAIDSLNEQISALNNQRSLSAEVDYWKNNSYDNDIDAASAFYSRTMRLSEQQGLEYSCAIIARDIPVLDSNNGIIYQKRSVTIDFGAGDHDFIGMNAVLACAKLHQNGIDYSIAHTHPHYEYIDFFDQKLHRALVNSFSGLGGDLGAVGDLSMCTCKLIGASTIYMANEESNYFYACTANGPVLDNGIYKRMGSYVY